MGTAAHPKLLALKAALSLPTYAAVGILESLWMAAAQWKDHGGIGEWNDSEIAAVIGWEGGAGELVEALLSCRWLDKDSHYRLIIHDWRDHAPHYLQERWRKRGGFPNNSGTFQEFPGTYRKNGELSAPNRAQPCPTQTNPILERVLEVAQKENPRFCPADVNAIYDAYPRHIGPAKAKIAIGRALVSLVPANKLPDPVSWLLERVQTFKHSPAGNQGKFTPHPATWFNQGRYDDDPAEWQNIDKGSSNGTGTNQRNSQSAADDRRAARAARECPENLSL